MCVSSDWFHWVCSVVVVFYHQMLDQNLATTGDGWLSCSNDDLACSLSIWIVKLSCRTIYLRCSHLGQTGALRVPQLADAQTQGSCVACFTSGSLVLTKDSERNEYATVWPSYVADIFHSPFNMWLDWRWGMLPLEQSFTRRKLTKRWHRTDSYLRGREQVILWLLLFSWQYGVRKWLMRFKAKSFIIP